MASRYGEGLETMADEVKRCNACGALVPVLAIFTGGICVDCYAKSPAGRAPLTAPMVRSMWGIK